MVLLMIGPLTGAHAYYIINYKTTNERVINYYRSSLRK